MDVDFGAVESQCFDVRELLQSLYQEGMLAVQEVVIWGHVWWYWARLLAVPAAMDVSIESVESCTVAVLMYSVLMW